MKRNDTTNPVADAILASKLSNLHSSYFQEEDSEVLSSHNDLYKIRAVLTGTFLSVTVNGIKCTYVLPDKLTMEELIPKPVSYFAEASMVSKGIHRFSELDVREYIYAYLTTPEAANTNFELKKSFVEFFIEECFDRDIGTSTEFNDRRLIFELSNRLYDIRNDANVIDFIMNLPKRTCIIDYALVAALEALDNGNALPESV